MTVIADEADGLIIYLPSSSHHEPRHVNTPALSATRLSVCHIRSECCSFYCYMNMSELLRKTDMLGIPLFILGLGLSASPRPVVLGRASIWLRSSMGPCHGTSGRRSLSADPEFVAPGRAEQGVISDCLFFLSGRVSWPTLNVDVASL